MGMLSIFNLNSLIEKNVSKTNPYHMCTFGGVVKGVLLPLNVLFLEKKIGYIYKSPNL